jgi:hypothetical protein
MPEHDPLSSFDMGQVMKPSVYLKFTPGEPVVVRVLTTDPYIFNSVFQDKKTGEDVISTKFAWTVYNFTAKQAQVMQTTPNLAKKLQELHGDVDFGANLKSIDLKITPPAPGVIAAYDVQVLPKVHEMTNEQIKAAMKINLDELFKDKFGMRMNSYDPNKFKSTTLGEQGGEDDTEEEDGLLDGGEPLNLDDIPF